jgi:hypothetical protein
MMLEIQFDIFEQTDGIRKAARGRLMKPALQHALKIWFKRCFPKHFTQQAFYQYADVYSRRRTRKPKDPRPLIETGELWSSLTRSARISGTGKRATLRMRGTWYLRRPGGRKGRRTTGRTIDKAAEITALNRAELIYLRTIIARSLHAGIAREKHGRHYRIGASYAIAGE